MPTPALEGAKELMRHVESDGVDGAPWLCANCGEPHQTNEGSCQNCGAQTFALREDAIEDGVTVQQPAETITAVGVVGWVVGIVTALHAIGALMLLTFAVPFFAVATVVSLPPARRWYQSQTGYTFTAGAGTLIYVLFMLVGYVALFFP